jgi:hypothetical protein
MAPNPRLAQCHAGIAFPSPVGLGCRIDSRLTATRALAQLGFGYLEIGPVAASAGAGPGPIERDASAAKLRFHSPQATISVDDARRRLAAAKVARAPLLARIDARSSQGIAGVISALTPHVAAFVATLDGFARLTDAGVGGSRPLLLALTADQWNDQDAQRHCVEAVAAGRVAGLIVDPPRDSAFASSGRDAAIELSPAAHSATLAVLRDIRGALGSDLLLIAAAGIHTPVDALDALAAGATLVQVDAGLVFSGPGLAKRINDAVLFRQLRETPPDGAAAAAVQDLRIAEQSWFWALILGLSLFAGGLLALAIAATRITLPYDEALTGLTRDELVAINPRLLAFMAHDRVTLAGTMLALGLIYTMFAAYGIRRGQHWAYVAVVASALLGFFTFFAFLGFGYFDPFHAFVTAILLQVTLLAMHAKQGRREFTAPPDLTNDDAWRAHQWGQLLFVISVLIVAGIVIVAIGMSRVFVREDLEFLGTTGEALVGAHPQLKPLVAHDRATFGGMLISCGVATLLAALWGFQRGHAWLWVTLMAAGNVAYIATLIVHLNVGYSSHLHLLPVYGGLAWLWAGGLFSYPYMFDRGELPVGVAATAPMRPRETSDAAQ